MKSIVLLNIFHCLKSIGFGTHSFMWSLDHWAILATLVLSSISDNRVFSLGTFSQVVLSIVLFINLSCNFSNLLAIWIFELLLSLSTSSTTVILLSEVTGNSWNCYISFRFMWSELLKNFSLTSRSLKKPYNTFHFYFFELNQKKIEHFQYTMTNLLLMCEVHTKLHFEDHYLSLFLSCVVLQS